MNNFFTYLSNFNRREQTTLLLGGLAVLLYLLWIAVLSPLQDRREAQQATNAAATQSLGRVQLLAVRIKQARNEGAQAGASKDNISRLIDTSLQANGLSMSGFQPGTAGEVRVRLDRVRYSSLMQWLYDIEYQHNINIRDLSIAATNDPGLVTVNIRLQKN